MKLILLGAPGAGKGTQARMISERLEIPAISTGNIIRDAMKQGTKPGLAAKKYVEEGGLVPDEIVIEMLKERLEQDDCKSGYILDGFPRTVPQAQALEEMGIVIDKVIDIEIPDEEIVTRLAGRRVCETCGASFHTRDNPPKQDGICDVDGGKLTIRKDDDPKVIEERLAVYHQQTEPLIDFYRKAGKFYTVDSSGEVENTTRQTMAALGLSQ